MELKSINFRQLYIFIFLFYKQNWVVHKYFI